MVTTWTYGVSCAVKNTSAGIGSKKAFADPGIYLLMVIFGVDPDLPPLSELDDTVKSDGSSPGYKN